MMKSWKQNYSFDEIARIIVNKIIKLHVVTYFLSSNTREREILAFTSASLLHLGESNAIRTSNKRNTPSSRMNSTASCVRVCCVHMSHSKFSKLHSTCSKIPLTVSTTHISRTMARNFNPHTSNLTESDSLFLYIINLFFEFITRDNASDKWPCTSLNIWKRPTFSSTTSLCLVLYHEMRSRRQFSALSFFLKNSKNVDVMAGIHEYLENVERRESCQADRACDRKPLLSIAPPIVT